MRLRVGVGVALVLLTGVAACRQSSSNGFDSVDAGPVVGGLADGGPVDAGSLPLNENAGLQPLFHVDVPTSLFGTPHLARALVLPDGTIVVANSLSVLVYRRAAGAGLQAVATIDTEGLRCTTLAFHPATNTILCTSADANAFFSIDASSWKLRTAVNGPWNGTPGYRQVFIQGSFAYLAGFQRGLFRMAIKEGGEFGNPVRLALGDFVAVDGDDTNVVALDRTKGLVLIRPGEGAQPIFTLPLNGPPVGLKVRGTRAIVALGSQGVAIVDLEARAVVKEVHPECVVFSADATETRLAVGCSTALLDYDLSQDPPRLFGYDTAEYGIIDVLFDQDEVLALDWRAIAGYRQNVGGRALQVDVLSGMLLEPEAALQLKVRNFGDRTLHLADGLAVEAGQMIDWGGPPPPASGNQPQRIVTEEEPNSGRLLAVVRAAGALNLGSTFPIEAPSRYVTFVVPDCALQWPVLEDLSWLSQHGGLPGGLQPLVITLPTNDGDPYQLVEFPKLWELEMKTLQSYFPGKASAQTFTERFERVAAIPGPDTTSDWSIDATGHVIGFDRVYRGAHPLR